MGVPNISLRQSHVLLRNQKSVQNSFDILDSYAYLFNAKNKFKILRGRGPAVLIQLFKESLNFKVRQLIISVNIAMERKKLLTENSI